MKTIIITGSTDGIGKLTARKLAKEQHQILIHGRNRDKIAQTVQELKDDCKNEHITGLCSDLSDFDSIQKMTSQMVETLSKVDVLINNAGVFKSPINRNADNLDIRFAVNLLAPYLLTQQLLPLLKKSYAPRVINLSSAAQSAVELDALKGKKNLSAQEAYAQSKLALTMWSFYLARKYDYLNVIAVNPGSLLNTRMVQEAYGQYWSPADKGANILYQLALSEDYKNSSGKYFDNDSGVFANAHRDAYDIQKIQALVDKMNEIAPL
ncbi:MAG: SDR family NAD(P)-dependent oxidoreductase [Bacteroidota bacterium]